VLNSPANPTGAVFPRELLEQLATIAVENDLLILSDEVYEHILFEDAAHVSIASLAPHTAARTITVNSVSKTHAMTGWRIGYAAFPGRLAGKVVAIQQVSTSAPSAISQRAALAALTGDQSHVERMVQAYAERRSYVLDRIDAIPRLRAHPPSGTFYCFVNIADLIGKSLNGECIEDSGALAALLRAHAGVGVVSGMPFGAERHIRISFAVAMAALEEGFDRIEESVKSLD